jgi:hypothetical protein
LCHGDQRALSEPFSFRNSQKARNLIPRGLTYAEGAGWLMAESSIPGIELQCGLPHDA